MQQGFQILILTLLTRHGPLRKLLSLPSLSLLICKTGVQLHLRDGRINWKKYKNSEQCWGLSKCSLYAGHGYHDPGLLEPLQSTGPAPEAASLNARCLASYTTRHDGCSGPYPGLCLSHHQAIRLGTGTLLCNPLPTPKEPSVAPKLS